MSTYLEDILKTLGWEDGFQIPVANSENQALENELAELTLERVKIKNKLDNDIQRVENLENHLKYIEQEYDHNQKLITTYTQEFQTEQNNLHTFEAERSKLIQETSQTIKQIKDTEQRQNDKRAQLEKGLAKLEKLKAEASWDYEAIKAWEENLQKREEDNKIIEQFSKDDEHKYRELEAKRQNLEVEAVKRRGIIVKLVSDLKNYELVLERTGKVIKEQAEEKMALVKQWKTSVKILRDRDNEIDNLEKQIFSLQENLQLQQELMDEQSRLHQNLIKNNGELEVELSELNTVFSRLRVQYRELTQTVLLIASECSSFKTVLTSTLNNLQKKRKQNAFLNEQIQERERRCLKYQEDFLPLEEKVKELINTAMTIGERTAQLQQIIEKEQFRIKTLVNDITVLQKTILKSQEEYQREVHLMKTQKYEMSSMINNINRLKRYKRDIQDEIDKEKESVYNVSYKMDDVKSQIHNIEFPFSKGDPLTEQLEAQIRVLEDKFNDLTEVKTTIQEQITKLLNDSKDLTALLVGDENLILQLNDKLLDQKLNFEGGQKELALAKSSLQENQVKENLLRLKASYFEKATKKEEKNIYNLQKFRVSLEEAMMERIVQINTAKDILAVKKRSLGEDRGRIKADLAVRDIRKEQFRKKYELVLSTLGKDEDGQPLTVAHFKIRKAQEKFFLQEEGDILDCKIKKAEKEIVAMENTLRMVNATNNRFKQSLAAVADQGDEMLEKQKLETEIQNVNLTLRELRKTLSARKDELEATKALLEATEILHHEKHETIKELQESLVKIHDEITKKEEKINRAKSNIRKLREKTEQKALRKYERDLDINFLKDANKAVRVKLLEVSSSYQETTPLIFRYSAEYNIKLDQSFGSSASSASSVSIATSSRSACSTPSSTGSTSSKCKPSAASSSRSSSNISTINVTLNL